MLAVIAIRAARVCSAAAGLLLALSTVTMGLAQAPRPDNAHLGIASCSGNNCHGATERPPQSRVPGNEYIIWSKRDKHRLAYAVLSEDRSIKMARALGLPDAVNAKICLDCHTDNVPANLRGPQFQISDGVGCEACHGGAAAWLGSHIARAPHAQNVAAGMYPTELPSARAEKCLSCHFGDETRFLDHRIYGAGHPRLRFELDTFTAIQPAHFVVDKSYVERKGRITDLQVWGAGQAIALIKRMDAILDPRRSRRGIFPDFVVFDCQSCHHDYGPTARPTLTGLPPGSVKLNDSNLVMLRVAAARVAPGAARSLGDHMLALHKATTEDWAAMQREAQAVRAAAQSLVQPLSQHDYSREDMRALADAVIAVGVQPDDWQVSHAEQVAMSLEAIIAAMKSAGYLGEGQDGPASNAMNAVYASFANEATVRPDAFATALRGVQRAIGR
jgi:cytochrome c554/c'-like protein